MKFIYFLDVEVALETHWTRFVQIAVNKALLNHKTRERYLKIIKLLLQNGADFNLTDEFGHRCHDDIDKCPQIIELFIEHGYKGPFATLLDELEEKDQRKPIPKAIEKASKTEKH